MDRGAVGVTTAADGSYYMENAYPMTQWLVMEAYDDRYYTTGITYQADNQPDETTVLGAGVDVSVLPIIGLVGPHRLGRQAVRAGHQRRHRRHGQLRHHPQRARPALRGGRGLAAGHPGPAGQPLRAGRLRHPPGHALRHHPGRRRVRGRRRRRPYAHGKLLNQYITETWKRPGADGNANGDGNCVAARRRRQPAGPFGRRPAGHRTAPPTASRARSWASSSRRASRRWTATTASATAASPGGFDPRPAPAPRLRRRPRSRRRRLPRRGRDPRRRPGGRSTRSPARRTSTSATATRPSPRSRRPRAPARCTRWTSPASAPTATARSTTPTASPASPCRLDPTDNPTFVRHRRLALRGPAEAALRHQAGHVSNRRSIAPTFNMFTDVPIPGRFWGLIVDDLNFSSDKKSLLLRREGRHPVRAGRHLRLHEPPGHDGRVGLQRPVRRPAALHQPHQLPDPLGRLRQPLPLRRQRPGRARAAERQLQARSSGPSPPSSRPSPACIVPADLAPTQVGVTVQLPGRPDQPGRRARSTRRRRSSSRSSKPYVDTRVGR